MTADYSNWRAYQYTPSIAASILFIALFGIVTAYGFYQFIRALIKSTSSREKREICSAIPFLVGGLFEIVGYIGRTLSHNDQNALGPYIIQSILLLVAPALFAASIYMTLGRIIRNIDCEKYSLIPLRWLTKIFVSGDVISFLLQAAGGGIMASSSLSAINTGEHLIVGGLFVQIVFFGIFMVVEVVLYIRVSSRPPTIAIITKRNPSRLRNWSTILYTLFLCSVLIFIRSILRVIEFIQGNDGYIISHEYFLYIFDATLMFLNMVLFFCQDIGSYYVEFKYFAKENTESAHYPSVGDGFYNYT